MYCDKQFRTGLSQPQFEILVVTNDSSYLVSSPGRDSRDSRSSRLAEATQKTLGTNALCTGSRILIWFLPHIYAIFTKSFFKSLEIITILRPF